MMCAAGCSSHSSHDDKPSLPAYIIYSPNAEPLNGGPLGKLTCEKAMANWFDRLSADHSGRIPSATFFTDARTQFERMDIDHNGYVVSEELDRFRAPYRQQPAQKQVSGSDTQSDQGQHKRSHDKSSGSHKTTGGDGDAGVVLSQSDPVMSADTNLDFRVTPEEFMQQAQDVFARLDSNHDGALDHTEVMVLCKHKE